MAGRAELDLLTEKMLQQVERIIAAGEEIGHDGVNWKPTPEGTNSVWVLATHTMENIKQNIMVVLGGDEDHRDRDAEFVSHGDDPGELRRRWEELRAQVRERMAQLSPDILEQEYDHPRRGRVTGRELLINAATHAAEHAGHCELTRDLYRAR